MRVGLSMINRIEKLIRTFWFYFFLLLSIGYISLFTDFYEIDITHTSIKAIFLLLSKTVIVCFLSMTISLIICHFIVKKN